MELTVKQMKRLMLEASRNGQTMMVMMIAPSQSKSETAASQPAATAPSVPAPAIAEKFEPSKTDSTRSMSSRRYSRYNFCRNLMSLAAGRTAQSNPDGWMTQGELATSICDILDVMPETAKEHIRRAEQMNLIVRKREGNNYFVRLAQHKPSEISFGHETAQPAVDLPD